MVPVRILTIDNLLGGPSLSQRLWKAIDHCLPGCTLSRNNIDKHIRHIPERPEHETTRLTGLGSKETTVFPFSSKARFINRGFINIPLFAIRLTSQHAPAVGVTLTEWPIGNLVIVNPSHSGGVME